MENLNYINSTFEVLEEVKEKKVKKFSEMISDKCYHRIYN